MRERQRDVKDPWKMQGSDPWTASQRGAGPSRACQRRENDGDKEVSTRRKLRRGEISSTMTETAMVQVGR